MADRYGLVAFPLTAPADGATVSDEGLDVLLAYLKAFINRYGATAWRARYFATEIGVPINPVMGTFTHNPEFDDFNEKDLPALFLYRLGGSTSEDRAEDLRVTYSQLKLEWVFPADRDQKRRVAQRPFLNAIAKLVDQAFRKERDSAYVAPGDTEPTATAEGSVVLVQAGIQDLRVGPPRPGLLQIPKKNEVGLYPSVEFILDIEEHRDIDKTLFVELDGVELDFTLEDGSVFEQATLT